MDNLSTNQLIRLLRKEQRMTQPQLYESLFSRSVYKKVEKNEKELTLSELNIISSRLGIGLDELLCISHNDTETEIKKLRREIKDMIRFPKGKRVEEKIKKTNQYLLKMKKKNIEWFNLYLFFSISFFQTRTFVLPPNKLDLEYILEKYSQRTVYTLVDYKIFLNCLIVFPKEDIQFLENLLFPVKSKELRNQEFIETVYLAYNNMISFCIMKKDYKKGLAYLKDVYTFENREVDYFSKIQLLYLESLLLHLQSKDSKNIKKELEHYLDAYNYAELVKKIGDTRQSNLMFDELERIKMDNNINYPTKMGLTIGDKPYLLIHEIQTFLNSIPPTKIN